MQIYLYHCVNRVELHEYLQNHRLEHEKKQEKGPRPLLETTLHYASIRSTHAVGEEGLDCLIALSPSDSQIISMPSLSLMTAGV